MRYTMRETCFLMEMHDRGMIAVVEVECILIIAFWIVRQTMIVSLIMPLLTAHNRVSSDVWRLKWGLKT